MSTPPPFRPPSRPIPGPPSPEMEDWTMIDHPLTTAASQKEPVEESSGDQSSQQTCLQKIQALIIGSVVRKSSSTEQDLTSSIQSHAVDISRPQSTPVLSDKSLHKHNLSTCIPNLIMTTKLREQLLPPSVWQGTFPPFAPKQASTITAEPQPLVRHQYPYQCHHRRRPSVLSSSSSSSTTFPTSNLISPSTESVNSTDIRRLSKGIILSRSNPVPIPIPNPNHIPSTEPSLFAQAADAVGSAWYPNDPTCHSPGELKTQSQGRKK